MFGFFTSMVDIATGIFNAAVSLYGGIILLVGWLTNALSQSFDYGYQILAMIPYQIVIVALYPILILIVFNIINFIKGWF